MMLRVCCGHSVGSSGSAQYLSLYAREQMQNRTDFEGMREIKWLFWRNNYISFFSNV